MAAAHDEVRDIRSRCRERSDAKAPEDPDQLLAATTGMLTLSLAASPEGPRHDVRIKPLRNELALRGAGWVENNRKTVETISGGRLGYLYLPDMLAGGVIAMTQPTANKKGLVVDVRYNRGIRTGCRSRLALRDTQDNHQARWAAFTASV